MRARLIAGVFVLAAGCAADPGIDSGSGDEQDFTESATALDANDKQALAQKGFSSDEIKAVADSIAISKVLGVQSFVSEANDGNAKKDASVRRESHGKQQGCVRAKVDVTTNANVGVFQKGKSYPAWLRLSNGGAYQKNDNSQHISRGIAIKMLGIEGTPNGTQDFLFINSPRFFIKDITHYPGFLKASGDGRLGFLVNLLFHLSLDEKKVILHRLSLKVANLLESPAYSAVPYAFGKDVVKYALAPCGQKPPTTPESHPPPDGSPDNYLEEAMNKTLEASDATAGVCYSFFVQHPRSEKDDPVDDPTQAWEGAFEEVAKITIPHGQHRGGPVDYRENDAECERMSFDPFNATAASEPRGKTNWTRKFVYAALAKFRRVEMPEIYARWQTNHDDGSIPVEYRNELKKLKDPTKLAPKVKETNQPSVDDGFKELGIVP